MFYNKTNKIMKQTAVEWLFQNIWLNPPENLLEILDQAKEIEKQNMINFLQSVFGMEGFDYEKCYDDFISRRKIYKQDQNMNKECSHENKTQHFSDVFGHYISCKDCGKNF